MKIDVTSQTIGLTTPLTVLIEQIAQKGWEVTKVKFSKKDDYYVAEAKNQYGEKITKTGNTDKTAVGNLFVAIVHHNQMRSAQIRHKLGSWPSYEDKMEDIAKAYGKASFYDPKAARYLIRLGDDSLRRAKVLGDQLHIEVVRNPEPYESIEEMIEDVHHKKHFFASRSDTDHPVWSIKTAIAFRVCHEILGHVATGAGFDWKGENLASAAHASHLDPPAQAGLFLESIAPSAYSTYYRSHDTHKVAMVNPYMKVILDQHPVHNRGIHPSQIVAPFPEPSIEFDVKHSAKKPFVDPGSIDINKGWKSGVTPSYGEGAEFSDPLNIQKAITNSLEIERNWWDDKTDDGEPDFAKMSEAVSNAFRVAILSPRKDLRQNAIHYQDLKEIGSGETDPQVHVDKLNKKREDWNASRFGEEARHSHKPWFQQNKFKKLTKLLANHYPDQDSKAKAERIITQWLTEEESKQEDIERRASSSEKRYKFDIEQRAYKAVGDRLEALLKDKDKDLDIFKESALSEENGPPQMTPEEISSEANKGRYPAFMYTHLKSLSQIEHNIKPLTIAAYTDITEHGGSGHFFRAAVMKLPSIPGVGPKVASFAWLLLAPRTSQLATVDTHMMDILGMEEKEMSPREYYKAERKIRAGLDHAGYGDIPLAQGQWAMWDGKRTKEPQDHSALAVRDPKNFDEVIWHPKVDSQEKGRAWAEKNSAPWWRATQEVRDAAGADYDENVGSRFSLSQVPFKPTEEDLRVPRPVEDDPENPSGLNVEPPPPTPEVYSTWRFESKEHQAESGEFHSSLKIPSDILKKIKSIVQNLDTEIEAENPEEYHMTWMFVKDDEGHRRELEGDHSEGNLEDSGSFEFTNARIDKFPAREDGDKDTIVIRFDSPEAKKVHSTWEKLNKEEYGIDPGPFAGNYKPHISIGWSDGDIPHKKLDLDFTSEGFDVTEAPESKTSYHMIPSQFKRNTYDEWKLGASDDQSLQNKIQRIKAQHPDLSIPEIWDMVGEDADQYISS